MRNTLMTFSLMSFVTLGGAQELSVGKYSGSYVNQQFGSTVAVTLEIQSVENGNIGGSGFLQVTTNDGYRGWCTGGFALTGTLKGNALDVRSAEPFGRNCRFRLVGTASGDKIQGKTAQHDIELKK